jgi:hypothetical protein
MLNTKLIDQQHTFESPFLEIFGGPRVGGNPLGPSALLELKSAWEALKATREKELVPVILVNGKVVYEEIGAGIQKERLDRMHALLDILEK